MNIFTANQVNQVYVVNSASDITVAKSGDDLYFVHKGTGGKTRSDLIPVSNIMYTKATKAANQRQKLMTAVVTLNSEAKSSSKPIVGQDYIMNLEMQNPIGMSPDNKYMTFGAVHVPTGMTTTQFYAKMVESVNKNVKNALSDYLTVGLAPITVGGITLTVSGTNADIMGDMTIKTAASTAAAAAFSSKTLTISYDSTDGNTAEELQEAINGVTTMPNVTVTVLSVSTLSADNTGVDPASNGIYIAGKESSWIKGLKQQKPIVFTVLPSTVTVTSGTYPNIVKTEVYWGDIIYANGKKITGGEGLEETTDTSNAPAFVEIPNGKLMADYEYFYMGERGDQYRYTGWPNYVPTTYLVKEDEEYDTISIHYFYTGSNHAVQKSEKDITLIIKTDGSSTLSKSIADSINALVTGLIDKSTL